MKGRPIPGARSIESARHPLVRLARELAEDRKARARAGLYVAWGLHLAQEALAAGARLRHVLAGPRLEESREGRDLLGRVAAGGVPIVRTTTRILESVAPGCGDQGILCLTPLPEGAFERLLRGSPSLLLAAHGVQDPGNLGSIIRTSQALGVQGVLALEGCADPFGSRAVRAGMGAHFRLPVAPAAASDLLAALGPAGLQVIAADPRGEHRPSEVDLTRSTALFVGSEGSGLPREVLEAAARRVRIPMAPGASSLNVHAAAAALLYEAGRQRGFAFA